MIYLVNSVVWLTVSIVMFSVPGFREWEIGRTGVSMAWLPLIFVAYNVVRWVLFRRRRRPWPQPSPPSTRTPEEYHPEFDFNRPDEAPK